MEAAIYAVIVMGFMEAGWGFWDSMLWPFYFGKHLAKTIEDTKEPTARNGYPMKSERQRR